MTHPIKDENVKPLITTSNYQPALHPASFSSPENSSVLHMNGNCKQMFAQWLHMCIYCSEKGRVNDLVPDLCTTAHTQKHDIFWFQPTSQTTALYTKHSRSLYCSITTLVCEREPFPSNATCPCKENFAH